MDLVDDDEAVVEHGLDFTLAPRVAFGVAFEGGGDLVRELDIALEIVVGFDDGLDIGDEPFLVELFEVGGVEFVEDGVSHTRPDVPDPVFEFEFGGVEQLETEILNDVGRGQDQDPAVHPDLLHVGTHFFGDTNGGAGFSGTKPMVEEERGIGGQHGQVVLDEELVGEELELGAAGLLGPDLDGGEGTIIAGIVEFLTFGDFDIELGVVLGGVEGGRDGGEGLDGGWGLGGQGRPPFLGGTVYRCRGEGGSDIVLFHDLNPLLLEITLVLGVEALFDEELLEPEGEDSDVGLTLPRGFIDLGVQLVRFQ
jgi:hypothetical protein